MGFSYILFIGPYAYEASTLRAYASWHALDLSLVRYGDDDMTSPSCCDWLIPGTADLYA